MKKLVLGMMILTSVLFGAKTSISSESLAKLSDSERIIVLDLIKNKDSNTVVPTTVEEVERWTNIGTTIGKTLAGSAKEMGIAVNEFAKTDVGFLVTALIIWNYLGGMIVHMFGGILILVVGIFLITKLMNNIRGYEIKQINGKDVKKYNKLEGEAPVWISILFLILFTGSTIVMFSF